MSARRTTAKAFDTFCEKAREFIETAIKSRRRYIGSAFTCRKYPGQLLLYSLQYPSIEGQWARELPDAVK